MGKKKIAVAMSGGVDSSVSAALLKDKGFEVIGLTMRLFRGDAAARLKSAKKAAQRLGIAHYVLNFQDTFRKKIVEYFCREYQRGRTPNPCIRCNKYIKFDALLKKAKQLGADRIATGHYARIVRDSRGGRFLLKKGLDRRKDQSYFLYSLSQRQLRKIILPLGELTKDEVRRIAKRKKLPAAASRDSQEICFIPDKNYGEFIKKRISGRKIEAHGATLNQAGNVIGRHREIIFYTIGQRKGIGIADKYPLYVTSINRKDNTITVGKKEDVYGDKLVAENVNFISIDKLKTPIKVKARIRYLHPAAEAIVVPQGRGRVKVKFRRPQWAITPGQAVVFFQRDTVVGGGTIIGSG